MTIHNFESINIYKAPFFMFVNGGFKVHCLLALSPNFGLHIAFSADCCIRHFNVVVGGGSEMVEEAERNGCSDE
jgi:hypothetical protein